MTRIKLVASQARSIYHLHWPDNACFTAEICSPGVIDILSLC